MSRQDQSTRPMNQSDTGVYIGLDLGTSGLKGVALAPGGTFIARAGAAYPTRRPSPGACEQAPQDWLTAVESVAAQLRHALQPRGAEVEADVDVGVALVHVPAALVLPAHVGCEPASSASAASPWLVIGSV